MLNTSFLKSSKLSACFGALLFGKEEIGDPLAPLGTPTLKAQILIFYRTRHTHDGTRGKTQSPILHCLHKLASIPQQNYNAVQYIRFLLN